MRRRSAAFNRFAKQHQTFEPDPRSEVYNRKITFFLSSQDECAALGRQWQSTFPPDVEVIRQACLRYPDVFFCVRFHPHQAKMPGDVESPFESLQDLDNLCIYGPHSVINTYELIDWSDCVVTFASTVGVESCWVGKPVIQLGPSFFDQLGVANTPATMDEFLTLLGDDSLPSGDRDNAARYAYFDVSDCDTIRHLDCDNGRNRVIGMRPKLRLGTRVSKRVNSLTRGILKMSYRWVA